MAMGRKRVKNKHLPRRLYLRSGSYYFVHADGSWERLLAPDGKPADYGTALKMWADLTGGTTGPIKTLRDAFDRYKLEALPKKSARSQKNNLQQFPLLYDVFGHMPPEDLEPHHVYAVMDAMRDKKGRHTPIAANRRKELLSHVYTYLIRWGRVSINPCSQVRRYSQPPRDRDVEAWEFEAVRAMASERMQCAMDIARLTGMREGDIIRLGRGNDHERGITVTTGKTKRKMRYLWTQALRDAWNRLISLQGAIPTLYLFTGRRGRPLSESGFQAEWQRLMARAKATGAIHERFTFHDIRAMAGGEHPVAHELLGNSPEVAERHYRRKPREVTPTR